MGAMFSARVCWSSAVSVTMVVAPTKHPGTREFAWVFTP